MLSPRQRSFSRPKRVCHEFIQEKSDADKCQFIRPPRQHPSQARVEHNIIRYYYCSLFAPPKKSVEKCPPVSSPHRSAAAALIHDDHDLNVWPRWIIGGVIVGSFRLGDSQEVAHEAGHFGDEFLFILSHSETTTQYDVTHETQKKGDGKLTSEHEHEKSYPVYRRPTPVR